MGIEEIGKVEKSTNTDGSYESSSSSVPPTDDHQADIHEGLYCNWYILWILIFYNETSLNWISFEQTVEN